MTLNDATQHVHDFWNGASCGEELYLTGADKDAYTAQMRHRYRLEPFLQAFARPQETEGLDVLEIGVGLGADHFDVVYSWGVLHHSPDTPRAVDETWRVLRNGGHARIMIHKHSLVGYMLWVRYGLLVGRPWRSLNDIYSNHLESPGTKAYSVDEARRLFARFRQVTISTVLTHGDLLESDAGQRHRGWLLTMAKRLWPRRLLRLLLPGHGLFMLIEARK